MLCLSAPVCFCLSVCLSLCVCLSDCLSLSLSLSLPLCPLSVSVTLFQSVYVLCLTFSLPLCLPPFLPTPSSATCLFLCLFSLLFSLFFFVLLLQSLPSYFWWSITSVLILTLSKISLCAFSPSWHGNLFSAHYAHVIISPPHMYTKIYFLLLMTDHTQIAVRCELPSNMQTHCHWSFTYMHTCATD